MPSGARRKRPAHSDTKNEVIRLKERTWVSGTEQRRGKCRGGFARNGDILQIPHIGSYRVKLTPVTMPPLRALPRNVTGVTSQVSTNVGDVVYNQVLELNSITMDSVFAEDTDPYNHYNVTTPVTDWTLFPPEQIGRFAPSRLDLEESGPEDSDVAAARDPPRA